MQRAVLLNFCRVRPEGRTAFHLVMIVKKEQHILACLSEVGLRADRRCWRDAWHADRNATRMRTTLRDRRIEICIRGPEGQTCFRTYATSGANFGKPAAVVAEGGREFVSTWGKIWDEHTQKDTFLKVPIASRGTCRVAGTSFVSKPGNPVQQGSIKLVCGRYTERAAPL